MHLTNILTFYLANGGQSSKKTLRRARRVGEDSTIFPNSSPNIPSSTFYPSPSVDAVQATHSNFNALTISMHSLPNEVTQPDTRPFMSGGGNVLVATHGNGRPRCCVLCGEVLRPLLYADFMLEQFHTRGSDDNPYVSAFLSSAALKVMLAHPLAYYHRLLDNRHLRKEATETWAMVQQVRRFVQYLRGSQAEEDSAKDIVGTRACPGVDLGPVCGGRRDSCDEADGARPGCWPADKAVGHTDIHQCTRDSFCGDPGTLIDVVAARSHDFFGDASNFTEIRAPSSTLYTIGSNVAKAHASAPIMSARIMILDLCCGKSLTASLCGHLFPDCEVIALDRRPQKFMPHFDALSNVRYVQADLLNCDALLASLMAPDDHGRSPMVVVLGMHLCGTLSEKAISIFNTLSQAKFLVLSPCCFPRPSTANIVPRANRLKVDQYDYWCLHLLLAVRASRRNLAKDDAILSQRNAVIVASKISSIGTL